MFQIIEININSVFDLNFLRKQNNLNNIRRLVMISWFWIDTITLQNFNLSSRNRMTRFSMLRRGHTSAFMEKLLILSLVFSLSHVNEKEEGSEDSDDEINPTTFQKMKNFYKNAEVISNSTYQKPIQKIKI